MTPYNGPNGKPIWRFSRSKRLVDAVEVPCGRCVGCRLERSRQWAVRCVHHAQMREDNCFITLTYNDEHLPHGFTLVKSHFQNFMKALRPRIGAPIEYFMCGEYGDLMGRPHYHAILFGVDFPDKVVWNRSTADGLLYKSDVLEALWGKGFCSIGALTFESAAYVARYALKKINGAKSRFHYQYIDPVTGEITDRLPEYVSMSLKRPIGKNWLTAYKSDVYPADEVVIRGRQMKPAKYYDKQLSEDERTPIKEKRQAFAKASKDNTAARREVREEVKLAQIKQLKRGLQ